MIETPKGRESDAIDRLVQTTKDDIAIEEALTASGLKSWQRKALADCSNDLLRKTQHGRWYDPLRQFFNRVKEDRH